jgi:hypothetical protein
MGHSKYGADHRTAQLRLLPQPDSQQANTCGPGKEIEEYKTAYFIIFSPISR